MPRNVEIKAVISNFDAFLKKVCALSGSSGETYKQVDTFFHVPNGRLKYREQEGRNPQLVFYERADSDGPKLSDFECCDVSVNSNLASVLSRAIPVKGVLKKSRTLCMVGQTRVHIDRVDDLGDFMELEVVLEENQTTEDGEAVAKILMDKLEISKDDLIKGSYMDHILAKKEKTVS